jgi:hypothetical protein
MVHAYAYWSCLSFLSAYDDTVPQSCQQTWAAQAGIECETGRKQRQSNHHYSASASFIRFSVNDSTMLARSDSTFGLYQALAFREASINPRASTKNANSGFAIHI